MKIKIFILFILALCLGGCSTHTENLAWQSEELTVADDRFFDIQPVSDTTERGVDKEILSLLTSYLKQEFQKHKIPLADNRQNLDKVLVVQSEFLVYEIKTYSTPTPPPYENLSAVCILRTRITHGRTNNVVAEIITVSRTNFGQGFFEPEKPEKILIETAASVAKELVKMRQP